jgi:hypothetical protein
MLFWLPMIFASVLWEINGFPPQALGDNDQADLDPTRCHIGWIAHSRERWIATARGHRGACQDAAVRADRRHANYAKERSERPTPTNPIQATASGTTVERGRD